MGIEEKMNQKLNKYPWLKRKVKRVYQYIMYSISSKQKCEGDIVKVSPDDPESEYFFGYYDKSPWDKSGRYLVCLKAKNTWSNPAPSESAEILLIDTLNGNKARTIASTNSWNVQQGCMMQWLGPNFDSEIIYNDFRQGEYCSVIKNVFSGEERTLCAPVYSVSSDGKFALTLDFSRLHSLRPGYGYSNKEDSTKMQKVPNGACIWKLDITNNELTAILDYKDLVKLQPRQCMENAQHKVNHIMINPENDRFMFLHRWIDGGRKYTRLITANIDGNGLYVLSDDDMVSHCCWKDSSHILAFERKKAIGNGYFLMEDMTQNFVHKWTHITCDGHPSYSPNGQLVLTDSYPNRKRISTLRLLTQNHSIVIGKVFSPFKYDNETRCDLHPRWSRDGKKVCFDSVHEGKRGVYEIEINNRFEICEKKESNENGRGEKAEKIKIVFLVTSFRKSGPMNVVLNIVKNMDTDKFEIIVMSIYEETKDTMLKEFLPYVEQALFCKVSKKDVLSGKLYNLEKAMDRIEPDIIHSTGVFADYAISKIKKYQQLIILHNNAFEDYKAKYGKLKGNVLLIMQLYAIRNATKVVTCSESLAKIYKEKCKLKFDFVSNGIDTTKYTISTQEEKRALREKLNISKDGIVFIFTGQLIKRKNVDFLLKNFSATFKKDDNVQFIVLGDGPLKNELQEKYAKDERIIFYGNVENVSDFLRAADIYASASLSEGLPNGVLEAMACGLPVVLSDIEQHKEILQVSNESGYLFELNNKYDLRKKINLILTSDIEQLGIKARNTVSEHFDARKMSSRYQDIYLKLVNEKQV